MNETPDNAAVESSIDAVLGPGGSIARRLGEAYEVRPQQIEMARAVERSFVEGGHLLVEAGTGVGKSFAYLLPAIDAAVKRKKRVVISTHTISLQEQLMDKDIPLLQSVYGDEFTAVLVKGRGNYLCQRRLQSAGHQQQMLFDEDRHLKSLAMIHDWAQSTTDGTLASLPQLPDSQVWDEVRAEHGNCLGKRCEFYNKCFWQGAKQRMQRANLLIVNHALFFSDLALRAAGVTYLPKYDHVIFDEAHTIEDVASQHFAVRLSEASVKYALRGLYDYRKGKGVLSTHGEIAVDACAAVVEAMTAAEDFFEQCAAWQDRFGRPNGRVHEKGIATSTLAERLTDVGKLVTAMYPKLDKEKPEQMLELSAKVARIQQMAQMATTLVDQTMDDAVYWLDISKRTPRRVTLSAAPVDVSAGLRNYLFSKTKSVVMTSATLCTGVAGTSASHRGTGFQPVIQPPRDGRSLRQGANLPHLTEPGGIYAVTFRLADSLPADVTMTAGTDRPDDAVLDAGLGACWMNRPEIADVVASSLEHFDRQRFDLLAWSVMPNHVHVVLRPLGQHQLPDIMHSIKRHSALTANRILERDGAFWQTEYHDHLIRDDDDLLNQVTYASENPDRAGLREWKWKGLNEDRVAWCMEEMPVPDHGLETRATKIAAPMLIDPAFRYIARRLGVDEAGTLQLGSPFDYAQQATLYLETNLPDPNDTRRFVPAATAKVEQYVRHTHGGSFVLFTSYSMLRQMADQLRDTFEHLGMPVLIQGQDLTPRQLLAQFRELDDAVLFGTSSFWQGIDVQGHKLRNVIIVKLPFSVPDEPIIEAKHEHIQRTGGNPFMDLSLPEAIIRLKQGFGRLIRSKTDKGIVVVLDSRVKTKRYGKQFLDALPDVRIVEVRD
jgi:Rad3-related DNA helicase/REP element-mobilizing transposase RayT